MRDLQHIEIIAGHLNDITLPALKRPPVGPGEPETEELVVWAVSFYAYSAIAHIRNVLDGLLPLLRTNNDAAAFPVCRHVYEWAMHAAYMNQQLSKLIAEKNWHDTFELFLQVDGGNSWIKKHGEKYVPGLPFDEIPNQLRLKRFVAAYEEHQRNFYKKEQDDVKDTYGLLRTC